jgi:hypothetical protein
MQSKLLQQQDATAPVVNSRSGQQMMPYEEAVATLFCTEEEEDAAIQVMLEDDPEGKKGIPYEQAKAELDRELGEWEADALKKLRNK